MSLISETKWIQRGVVVFLLALVGLGVFAWFIRDQVYDVLDPTYPGFSAGEARFAVARELCPNDPDRLTQELIVYRDSNLYGVYVRASSETGSISDIRGRSDSLAFFTVIAGLDNPDELRIDPVGERSTLYLEMQRASPGCH